TLYLQLERDMPNQTSDEDDDQMRSGLSLEASFAGLGVSNYAQTKAAVASKRAAEQSLYVTEVNLRQQVSSLLLNRQMQQLLQ
ncbi:hypothetical protein Q4595_29195, partial [Wenyingzhuangia sp. 1_MG-2023]|nr:hypothetical protein [Wenyingzhuangia sp. 1_MG-2023]